MVGETQDRLQIGKTVPSVATNETPEAVAHAGVESFQAMVALRGELRVSKADTHPFGIRIVNHRHEWTAASVVAANKMKHQIVVVSAFEGICIRDDERYRLAFVT